MASRRTQAGGREATPLDAVTAQSCFSQSADDAAIEKGCDGAGQEVLQTPCIPRPSGLLCPQGVFRHLELGLHSCGGTKKEPTKC